MLVRTGESSRRLSNSVPAKRLASARAHDPHRNYLAHLRRQYENLFYIYLELPDWRVEV